MKKYGLVFLLFFSFLIKVNSQNFSFNKTIDSFYLSRDNSDYKGLIHYGEKLKSSFPFVNIEDSIFLTQINALLSVAYYNLGEFDTVIELLDNNNRSPSYQNNILANDNQLTLLSYAAKSFLSLKDYKNAENILNEAIEIINTKKTSPNFKATIPDIISKLYFETGRQDSARNLLLSTINAVDDLKFTLSLYYSLIGYYIEKNEIIKAEEFTLKALEKLDVNNGSDPLGKQILLSQLKKIYLIKGDTKQISKINRVLDSLDTINNSSPNSKEDLKIQIFDTIQLAIFFSEKMENQKAINLVNEAIKIAELNFGNESAELISVLNGCAIALYFVDKDLSKKIYLRSMQIADKQIKYFEEMEIPSKMLANLFQDPTYKLINIDSAIYYSKKHLFIVQKYFDSKKISYASAYRLMAATYFYAQLYDSSTKYFLLAKELMEINNFSMMNEYHDLLYELATNYFFSGNNSQSEKYFILWNEWSINYLKDNFISHINNIETFNKLIDDLQKFDYWAFKLNTQILYKVSFENKIRIKNLQLNYFSKVRKELLENKESKKIMELLNSNSNSLYDLKSFEIKQEISKGSLSFKLFQNRINLSIDDIKGRLNKNEAIIEFGKFQKFKDPDATITADFYFALILSSNNNIISVPIGYEDEITMLTHQNNDLDKDFYLYSKNGAFDVIIKPLIPFVRNYKIIYVSPTGILNKLNLAALFSERNQLLSDTFDFVLFSDYENIENSNKIHSTSSNLRRAILYGGIEYGENVNENPNSIFVSRSLTSFWRSLPGTVSEIRFIDSLFKRNHFQSDVFSGKVATEQTLYQVVNTGSPFILHIATHGFSLYNKNLDIDINPSDLCGILFAGSNKSWNMNLKPTQDKFDGIMFGTEMAGLNLSKCELAVLSACETARGINLGNEGVFSLARALKLAGAKKCIVSLWKVPDKQTSELFIEFYSLLISGKSIHESFYTAQRNMSKRYPSPYYWAGFVLYE